MSDGARLFTRPTPRRHSADQTAVLLIHGGPGLWDYLEPLDALLDDLSIVFRYDQRGCGRSSVSDDLSMARYISDIEDLRAHWSLERLVLVGHSFGAALALAYAGTYPARAASVGYLSGVGIGDWMTPFRAEVARRRRAFGSQSRIAELSERQRRCRHVPGVLPARSGRPASGESGHGPGGRDPERPHTCDRRGRPLALDRAAR